MTTPINGQNSKRFESIPNQVHNIFGWELKMIDLGVEWKNRLPKFPSKVKSINTKVKFIILWIWKGHFGVGRSTFA